MDDGLKEVLAHNDVSCAMKIDHVLLQQPFPPAIPRAHTFQVGRFGSSFQRPSVVKGRVSPEWSVSLHSVVAEDCCK